MEAQRFGMVLAEAARKLADVKEGRGMVGDKGLDVRCHIVWRIS